MRILIAPDKFKGSLGAAEVGAKIASGLRRVLPRAEIEIAPVADGGEGTAEVICQARQGEWVQCGVHDALGREVQARYVWLHQARRAVMEMSAAAGLAQLAPNDRDPMRTSTFGVGEMLQDAAHRGATEILLGLGGSATNDGGLGMARALGFRFLDREAAEITASADLRNLCRIEQPNELVLPAIVVASDVRNPLLGPRGATRVFAPQKGASAQEVEILEQGLTRLAEISAETFGSDQRLTPGAGAAGGLGFGLLTFCDATLRPGFEVVAEATGLRAKMERVDVVITGEGKLDEQTLDGKAPVGVARMARELGKRVFAIVGEASEEPAVREMFDAILALHGPSRTTDLLERRASELASRLSA